LLYEALLNTRGNLLLPLKPSTQLTPLVGDIDKPIAKWSPDVRSRLYEFEFMQGLRFQPSPDSKGAEKSRFSRPPAELLYLDNCVLSLALPPDLDMVKEVRNVLDQAARRRDRGAEILCQVAVPLAFASMTLNLHPDRHRHVFELLNTIFLFGELVVMQFKNHFNFPRPADVWPPIQPIIMTPGHASYPAGHAVQGYLMSTVFGALLRDTNRYGDNFQDYQNNLDELAARIAENRVVAGFITRWTSTGGANWAASWPNTSLAA